MPPHSRFSNPNFAQRGTECPQLTSRKRLRQQNHVVMKVATLTVQKDTGWSDDPNDIEFVLTVGDHDVILSEEELRSTLARASWHKPSVEAFMKAARAEWRTGIKEKKG
jgi:hypothetical protein